MKKYIRAILFLALAHFIFASCAQGKFNDLLSCSEVASALESEILSEKEYASYQEREIKYLIDNDNFDSCRILYSISSDDIGEIGVLHAKDAEHADKLIDDANEYIENYKEQKSDFIRNYMPEEIEKLENARVKRFGNYVIYTILPSETADKIFQRAESLLSK